MRKLTTGEVLNFLQTQKVVKVVPYQEAIPCKHEGIKWYISGFVFESGNLLGIVGDEESTDYYLATIEEQIKE